MLARLRVVAAAAGRRHIGGFAASADAAPTVAEKVCVLLLVLLR